MANLDFSCRLINGALPPSSNDSLFKVLALFFIMSLPTFVLPVNDIFLTFVELHKIFPISTEFCRDAGKRFNTPEGNPTVSITLKRAMAVNGNVVKKYLPQMLMKNTKKHGNVSKSEKVWIRSIEEELFR
jgi:hypothetical protein